MEIVDSNSQVIKYRITWDEIKGRIKDFDKTKKYYGIPRGGQYISAILNPVDTIDEADIIVDDLIDSGKTKDKYSQYNKPFVAIFNKQTEIKLKNKWLIFPWEDKEDDIEDNIVRILQYINEDVNREGLVNTPSRMKKVLNEFFNPVLPNITIFSSNGYNQMVVENQIPFYSFCEHHFLPFFGYVSIGYIPNKHIIGLSKLSRIVDYYSRRLNTQEYLTENIANFLNDKLKPLGCGVTIKGRHLCKEMRGVKTTGEMTTTALKGMFLNGDVKSEFLNSITLLK